MSGIGGSNIGGSGIGGYGGDLEMFCGETGESLVEAEAMPKIEISVDDLEKYYFRNRCTVLEFEASRYLDIIDRLLNCGNFVRATEYLEVAKCFETRGIKDILSWVKLIHPFLVERIKVYPTSLASGFDERLYLQQIEWIVQKIEQINIRSGVLNSKRGFEFTQNPLSAFLDMFFSRFDRSVDWVNWETDPVGCVSRQEWVKSCQKIIRLMLSRGAVLPKSDIELPTPIKEKWTLILEDSCIDSREELDQALSESNLAFSNCRIVRHITTDYLKLSTEQLIEKIDEFNKRKGIVCD